MLSIISLPESSYGLLVIRITIRPFFTSICSNSTINADACSSQDDRLAVALF